ncbi:MAG: hypothetical protein JW939_00720 [Candidatus Thermoplasmatota archaeon]|nr:hypothetical protein [Candidatus Thermoplasmatota archaeon]
MSDLDSLKDHLIKVLDEEEKAREGSFSMSRDLIRACRKLTSELVQEREIEISELRGQAVILTKFIEKGGLRPAFAEDALAEYCEVEVLRSILFDEDIPHPGSLGMPERAFVLGLCDSVGEMRRIALNRLLRADLDGAARMYEKMKVIGHVIEGLVYPSGMIPLKKKQDVVRSLLDRTGGELAVARYSPGRVWEDMGGTEDE